MSPAEQLASVTRLPGMINSLPSPEQVERSTASTLPDHDISIDDIRVDKPRPFDGGVHIDRHYRMIDSNRVVTKYTGRVTLAESQSYDILLSHRLPWCTTLDGTYDMIDEEHARRGSSGVRVSSRQTDIVSATLNLADALVGDNDMLAYDSYAHHVILDDIDELEVAAPKEIIETGDSKAAITNFAVQAYAPRFRREVVYSDITDPCLEHGVRPRMLRPKELKEVMHYFGVKEPKNLVAATAEYSNAEKLRMARTVSLWPGFLIHQVATGFALFAGKGGGFVDHIPNSSRTAVGFFNGSPYNHGQDWERRLAPFTGVYTYWQDGTHLSILERNVQGGTIDRVDLTQELLKTVLTPDELDAAHIVAEVAKRQPSVLSGQSSRAARQPARTAGWRRPSPFVQSSL
ncbi:MAG: hypothetical protein JWN82_36 [Candidatus Saccharibacteria bacterium]|nr:hypothetical protein [Candidatus Saccharibacteria bacterium]